MSGRIEASKAWHWLGALGAQLRDTYRLGLSIAWLCPPIFALIVLPEFAQHCYEIALGMHAADPVMPTGAALDLFWRFAYVKIAGLVLGMLLTVRFWMRGASLGRTLRFGRGEAGRLVVVMLVYGLIGAVAELAPAALTALGMAWDAAERSGGILELVALVPQILLLPWFLSALGGDSHMNVRRSARAAFRGLVNLVVLLPAAFIPPAALHELLHVAARGVGPAPLWALMAVDSLVVGLIGTLVGSALFVFCRAAAAADRP